MKRVVALTCLVACGGEADFEMPPPDFGGLELGDLTGEIVITDTQDEVVARGALEVTGSRARGTVPALPPGTDLRASVVWSAGGFVVAQTEPAPVRVDAGGVTELRVLVDDYTYPDDDGDGASNIYEVAHAVEFPVEGANAAGDPAVVPIGFFDDVVRIVPVPDLTGHAVVWEAGNRALITTERFDGAVISDHKVHDINLLTYARQTTSFDCGDLFVFELALRTTVLGVQGVIGCTQAVQAFTLLPSFSFEDSIPVDSGLTGVAYSKSGDYMYAVGPNDVLQFDAGPPYELRATVPLLVSGLPCALADSGRQLLIADCSLNVVHVVAHTEGLLSLDASFTDFEELILPNPTDIAVHPAGHRMYVATNGDGSVHVVDITGAYPILDWRDVAVIPVGQPPLNLEIDPRGYWVYATGFDRTVRINTLTNEVEWEFAPGQTSGAVIADITISAEGRFAALAVSNALMLLGHTKEQHYEVEPNETLENATPLGEVGVGWVAGTDSSSIAAGALFPGDTDVDTYEDLWRLAQLRLFAGLGIAVIAATTVGVIYKVALLDENGTELDVIGQGLPSNGNIPVGTGMMLIAEATASPRYVAISAHDAGGSSAYQILTVTLPTLSSVGETDSNDRWQDPQSLLALPTQITGNVSKSETGTLIIGGQDYPDCFALPTTITHLGIRLSFAAEDDLDLAVVNAGGTRINQHVFETGNQESFIFEPRPAGDFVACVGIANTNETNDGGYTLTFIDLSQG